MPRLDLHTRERVVALKRRGYTYKAIQQPLQEEDITVSIKSLYLLVAEHAHTNSLVDRPRLKHQRILSEEHYCTINSALVENDELTTRQIHSLLVDKYLSLSVSLNTVKRKHNIIWAGLLAHRNTVK